MPDNSNKKLLIIGINYFPEITGIGKYTAEFSSFLSSERSFDVTVVTGNPYYPQWKLYNGYKNSFTKEFLSDVLLFRSPLYIPNNPSGVKRLIQDALFFICSFFIVSLLIFKRKRFDLIFIPVPSFLLGFIGLYYRFFFSNAKVVYHIQDLQIDAAENLGMINNKPLLKILYGLERYILKHVDFVSTISEGMKGKILAKTPNLKQCLLFPNWINSKNIFPLIPIPPINDSLLRNKKIIFYSGAIGEKQGLEMVLEAANFFNENTNLVFVISGEGPYKNKLQEYANKLKLSNVVFLNLLPINEFNEMLNRAYLHLVVQKESGSDLFLPSKLTNILGVGGAVIVTAAKGTSLYEIINKNECGIVIPPSDLNALCDTITLLVNDLIFQQNLKSKALDYAVNNLFQSSVTDKFIEKVLL